MTPLVVVDRINELTLANKLLLSVLLIYTQAGADTALTDYVLREIIFLFGIPVYHTYSEEIEIPALYNFSVRN